MHMASPWGKCFLWFFTLGMLSTLSGCVIYTQPEHPNTPPPQQQVAPVDPGPSARPGQCKVIRRGEYEEVLRLGLIGKRFAVFSKLKNDQKPQGPYRIANIQFMLDRGQWGVILINGVALDTADVMVEISQGSFLNLTTLTQFASCKGRITDIQRVIYLPAQVN